MTAIARTNYESVAFLFGGVSTEHTPSVKMFEFLRVQLSQTKTLPFRIASHYYLDLDGTVFQFNSPDQLRLTSGLAYVQDGVTIKRSDLVARLLQEGVFVFSLIVGREGEDGELQGVMQFLGIPSNLGSIGSAYMSIDKWILSTAVAALFPKQVTPIDSMLLETPFDLYDFEHAVQHFGNREFVIKPNRQGSSMLTSTSARLDKAGLQKLAEAISDLNDEILLQERIRGREISCGCLRLNGRWQSIDCIALEPHSGFMGSEEKSGLAPYKRYSLEASHLRDRIERLSCEIASRMDFHTSCRFDYIVTKTDDIHLLEANSQPGLLETSLYVVMLQHFGLNLIDLIRISMENEEKRRSQNELCKSRIHNVVRDDLRLLRSSSSPQ